MKTGVITLLDVLGWKGIWQRRSGADAIQELTKLVSTIEKNIHRRRKRYENTPGGFAVPFPETRVISISDTIAIVSEIEDKQELTERLIWSNLNSAITYQSIIVARLIRESILAGIPLRGAMAVGEYEQANNMLVGPAIDEVASWYELCDWIGVIQTPSASLRPHIFMEGKYPYYKPDEPIDIVSSLYDEAPLVVYHAPGKTGRFRTNCINWPVAWFAPDLPSVDIQRAQGVPEDDIRDHKDLTLEDFKQVILSMAPIFPEVYKKYDNSMAFYQKCFDTYHNASLKSNFKLRNEMLRWSRTHPGENGSMRSFPVSDPKAYTID